MNTSAFDSAGDSKPSNPTPSSDSTSERTPSYDNQDNETTSRKPTGGEAVYDDTDKPGKRLGEESTELGMGQQGQGQNEYQSQA